MKVMVIPAVISTFGMVTKELEIEAKRGDHQNYRILEIGQNSKKSPGDLRGLAITHTPVENHQLTILSKR